MLRDGKPVRLRVTTGLSDGSQIEVKSSELREGDKVITSASTTGGASDKAAASKKPRGNNAQRGGASRRRGVF